MQAIQSWIGGRCFGRSFVWAMMSLLKLHRVSNEACCMEAGAGPRFAVILAMFMIMRHITQNADPALQAP